jgi:hypothetical protein
MARKSNKKNMKRTNKKVKQSRRKMTRKLRKGAGPLDALKKWWKGKDKKVQQQEQNRYMEDGPSTKSPIQDISPNDLWKGNTPKTIEYQPTKESFDNIPIQQMSPSQWNPQNSIERDANQLNQDYDNRMERNQLDQELEQIQMFHNEHCDKPLKIAKHPVKCVKNSFKLRNKKRAVKKAAAKALENLNTINRMGKH